jgi:hypothetical protein
MNRVSLRPMLVPLMGAALCLALMPHPGAAQRTTPIIEQLTGRSISVEGNDSAGRIDIYIERWSSDEDLAKLRGPALDRSPSSSLLAALQQPQRYTVGVVLMPGVQGHGARARLRTPKDLLFVRQISTPTGRRLVAISDEHLGIGESRIDARKEEYEFNLIDIRFGPDGTGVGKIATESGVVYNGESKILEVKDFAKQPARLIDVKSLKGDMKSLKG